METNKGGSDVAKSAGTRKPKKTRPARKAAAEQQLLSEGMPVHLPLVYGLWLPDAPEAPAKKPAKSPRRKRAS
ncbi:hypothetical protein [Limibacillus halophilus]|jgi:hypothetical protein